MDTAGSLSLTGKFLRLPLFPSVQRRGFRGGVDVITAEEPYAFMYRACNAMSDGTGFSLHIDII